VYAVQLIVGLMWLLYVGLQLAMILVFTDRTAGTWVGFVVVTLAATALAVGAVVMFERTSRFRGPHWGATMPVAPRRPRAAGAGRRMLVVADSSCLTSAMCARVMERTAAEGADVLVVAPVLLSPLHYATDDDAAEWRDAESRARETAELLRRMGARARGEVGADNPLEAIHDALGLFNADEIIVVTPPDDRLNWQEQGLIEDAARTTSLPVTHVTVEADTTAVA
jgi:hypothetical protein